MAGPNEADEVTLGDKNVETAQFDRYKGRKGVTDRIAVLSATLMRTWSYYHENTMFRAPKDPPTLEHCKAALGEPQQRFGMVLFHYSTDDTGSMLVPEKCKGKVRLWAISEARYEELSGLHRNWPLLDGGFSEKQHDISIKCTEEQYQRMTFTPTPDAHWKSKEAWYKALKEKEAKAREKLKLAMGRQLEDSAIMELLGASTAAPTTGGTENQADVDLSDILDD